MADPYGAVTVYGGTAIIEANINSFSTKAGHSQMLRGGVAVEVSSSHQAKIAAFAGACAVVVGGVDGRMPDPLLVKEIKRAVSVPVIACARVGHFVEAQILEKLGIDYIDENELLAAADDRHFINKQNFQVPFICGCRNLGEALQRYREGASMIRIQGDLAGDGDIAKTVRNVRYLKGEIRFLNNMDDDEVFAFAKKISAPYDLVVQTKLMGRLPVVQFAAGGISTPADAALMMQLGCDGVFVGMEVFHDPKPYTRVRKMVQAVRHYNDPQLLAETSSELENAMEGMNLGEDRIP